ncbi:tyrosine recombinase [Dysgonomonas sp. ZJ709]|uniref:tyrosine recombinase n=1 Tax=Dysgonomonas sp. ZJ709 TaxID=2709797 RepID=UPI0013ED188D|nr:tyrosine recombinase [Dysgonomonas sp. ZJ709]
MLTKGVSIESVSMMLGHTDIKTTQIYAKILNQKVKQEVYLVKDKFDNMMNCYAQNNVVELR